MFDQFVRKLGQNIPGPGYGPIVEEESPPIKVDFERFLGARPGIFSLNLDSHSEECRAKGVSLLDSPGRVQHVGAKLDMRDVRVAQVDPAC